MINARSNFKNVIRKKRYAYDKSKMEKFIAQNMKMQKHIGVY